MNKLVIDCELIGTLPSNDGRELLFDKIFIAPRRKNNMEFFEKVNSDFHNKKNYRITIEEID